VSLGAVTKLGMICRFDRLFSVAKLPPRSLCAAMMIRSEANGVASPRAVRKHSKGELIAFFRDIQTSIAESSPKTSRRTRKPSSDPFEEVENKKQSYGMWKLIDLAVFFLRAKCW
jgi:hypothetical protein